MTIVCRIYCSKKTQFDSVVGVPEKMCVQFLFGDSATAVPEAPASKLTVAAI